MNWWDEAMNKGRTIEPPFTIDQETRSKYVAAVASLAEIAEKGYFDLDADDADALLDQHIISISWNPTQDIELNAGEVGALVNAINIDDENGVVLINGGREWVIGVTIYRRQ